MLKASRKSRRVLLAGATGIAALTVAGLGLTASGAAAEQIRTVAQTQVSTMTETTTPPAPVDPVVEAAIGPDGQTTTRDVRVIIRDKDGKVVDLGPDGTVPAGAKVYRNRFVIRDKDGKMKVYTGPEADAYLAANPDVARYAGRHPGYSRHRIVIRGKDGKTETYEGADADAYLKAHPEMRPPMPPVPPVVGMVAPVPPAAPVFNVRTIRRGPGQYQGYAMAYAPEVIHGDCGGKDKGSFVVNEKTKDGKPRIIVCEKRIELFAADHARLGKLSALNGLKAGRAAIEANRELAEAERVQALAGIDAARAAIEAEMKADKSDD